MWKLFPAWRRPFQIALAVAVAFLLVAATIALIGSLLRDRGAYGGGPTGTQPPTVDLLSPVGGERWTGGSTHPIAWGMNDDADVALFVRLYYRVGPGGSWTLFHSGTFPTASNATFFWTLPAVDAEDAAIRVCAQDSDGLVGCDESGSFAIDSTPPVLAATSPADAAVDVPLDAPLIARFSEPMSPPSVEAAFFLTPTAGRIVFSWSASNDLVTITHDPFRAGAVYAWGFACPAKDASDPGNPLAGCPRTVRFLTEGGGNGTLPDLTLSEADIWSVPADPAYGDAVTIYANVHNVGTADAHNVSVRFYDSGICLLTVIYDIGVDVIPYIPAGGSAVASRTWDTTQSADGRDLVYVEADAWRAIPELDEGNNWAVRHIYVRDTPCESGNGTGIDLSVTSQNIVFTPTETPEVGQTIWIHGYVRNVGTEDAVNVTVRFFDSFNGSRSVVGEGVIPSIPAGWIGNATVSWTAGPGGWHTIEVVADPDDAIPEWNEGNNAATRDIFVGPPAPHPLFVQAWTFDNDKDGRYDDVVILVYDSEGHAVEGASVYIDGVFYGLTPDTGLLVAYNFRAGTHAVLAVLGPQSARTTFVSEG